jgi:hypothetical protein
MNKKILFSTVNNMLHRTTEKLYPPSKCADKLANDFAEFFSNKITKIRNDLVPPGPPLDSTLDLATVNMSTTEFPTFAPVSEDQLYVNHVVSTLFLPLF